MTTHSSPLHWAGGQQHDRGVRARAFTLQVGGRTVPGMLWTPAQAAGPRPLVLLGHGGSQHKTAAGIVALAGRFVRDHGFAAAAIDGPIHGERRGDGQFGLAVQAEFAQMWTREHRIDAMVADWRATLDALLALGEVDAARIGWYGVSMGTAYGLPLLAREPRIRAALLGMWGAGYPNSGRLLEDAPAVRCAVLFQLKWDDQFFDREGQLALFDRLGTHDRRCRIYLGAHTPVEGEQLEDVVEFLAARLRPDPART